MPECMIEAINHPTKDKVASLLFAWNDIREVRRRPVAMYAVMNDSERSVPKALADGCRDYGVHVVRWSGREQFLESLSA